jgi:hypothetical protein
MAFFAPGRDKLITLIPSLGWESGSTCTYTSAECIVAHLLCRLAQLIVSPLHASGPQTFLSALPLSYSFHNS